MIGYCEFAYSDFKISVKFRLIQVYKSTRELSKVKDYKADIQANLYQSTIDLSSARSL